MDKQIKSTRKLAIDDIYRIGTPDAAVKLVPFLWDEDEDFAIYVAWHLGVLLKNPEVEEKLSKYPLKSEQTPIDELTYIWRPFETNSDSALFTITSRLAYLIKVSSTENIPQPILPVDPRIIIPVAAIEIIEQAKLPKKTKIKLDFDALFIDKLLEKPKDFAISKALLKKWINTPLGDSKVPNNWQFKLSSLNGRLQLNLLNTLMNSRTATRSDWIKLYAKDVNYNFEKSWHYYIVLGSSIALYLIAVSELFTIMFLDPMNIIHLIVTPSFFLLISYFWLVVWVGIKRRRDPQFFIAFGLLGIMTFLQELQSLLIYHDFGITINHILGTWIAIAIGQIAGVGLGAWYRAKDKIDWGRYLAIFAFPFFCTFPIIFGYSSYAFYDWFGLTWQQITIIWIGILGVCTVLWQWGQKLDYEARNPFKGILDSVKDDGDVF